jgi:NADH-quinone oxidoreductase subunit K
MKLIKTKYMLVFQISINTSLFFISLFGTLLNHSNVLKSLVGIELMLMCANMNFAIFSLYLDDMYGQVFSIFIFTIAAAESAIGLALLIISYETRGSLELTEKTSFRS